MVATAQPQLRERAAALAQRTANIAAGSGVELPDHLAIWQLAGGRPGSVVPEVASEPGWALALALEPMLEPGERKRGAHHTPRDVAERVAAMALPRPSSDATVVDPACGAGALLLAAAERLLQAGAARSKVAADLLWAADVDPLAAATCEAAIALWSGGVAPRRGQVRVADVLLQGAQAWAESPGGGFAALVANPPFQGQLSRATARRRGETSQVRAALGDAVGPYSDTAALFLVAASELVAPGGAMALVLPQSVVAARDAEGARRRVSERASLREMWAPARHVFAARVMAVVVAFDVGRSGAVDSWTDLLADARQIPRVELGGGGSVADMATAVTGFRDQYYALEGRVRESSGGPQAPLVTSGSVGVGSTSWGEWPVRFGKRAWERPEVDVAAVAESSRGMAAWLDRVRVPKVVVASQTHVVEAWPDHLGTAVPVPPAVSLVPHDPGDVARLAAALCAPPVAAWAARQSVGTGLTASTIRVPAGLALRAPLPLDAGAWVEATVALAELDHDRYAEAATVMHRLPTEQHRDVVRWWRCAWRPPVRLR